MAQSIIRWRKEDSIELQRAINTFNRNVKKLQKLENIVDYLPETVNLAYGIRSFATPVSYT